MAKVVMLVTNACALDPRVLRQARWLVEAGHQVTVHAFDRGQEHALLETVDGVNVVRHHLGVHPYGASFATLRRLRAFRHIALRACEDATGPRGVPRRRHPAARTEAAKEGHCDRV